MAQAAQSYTAEIEITYLSLEENFKTLYQRCRTHVQKKHLRENYSLARYAFWKASDEEVLERNAVCEKTYDNLKSTNAEINEALRNAEDITVFLKLAGEATRLAASLAALAAGGVVRPEY